MKAWYFVKISNLVISFEIIDSQRSGRKKGKRKRKKHHKNILQSIKKIHRYFRVSLFLVDFRKFLFFSLNC